MSALYGVIYEPECNVRKSYDRIELMVRDAAEVLKDTLALPVEARAAVIDSLIESLDCSIDEGAEEAWREEIRRRLQEIESGAVQRMEWEDARRRLRAWLER